MMWNNCIECNNCIQKKTEKKKERLREKEEKEQENSNPK